MTAFIPMARRLRRCGAFVIFVSITASFTQPATTAAQATEPARVHFQAGTQYYERADYESALREFESAYRLAPHAELLFNISQCHERLGNLEAAIETLRAFVSETDNAELRELNTERIANLERRHASQQSQEPSVQADEPPHVEPPTSREAAPPAQSEPSSTLTVVGWVAVGAGAAVLMAFGVLGGVALAEHSDLEERCVMNGVAQCGEADVSTLTTLTTAADIALSFGVAAAVTGVVILLVSQSADSATASLDGSILRF